MRWDDQDKPADAGAWLATLGAGLIFVIGPALAGLILWIAGKL